MAALTSSSRKQPLKADHNCSLMSSQSHEEQPRPASSLLGSPRLFRNLLTNCAENVMSPTSMLDSKYIFGLRTPSLLDKKAISSMEPSIASKHPWENSRNCAIGLAIITSDDENPTDHPAKITTRASVLGSQLKIQVPPVSPTTPPSITEFTRSPSDFGTKTRNLTLLSPSSSFRKRDTPESLPRQLSVTEMELSEDYTCVISHGPNPKTTHIFDNYIVGCYSGVLSPLELKRSDCCFLPDADNLDDASGGSNMCKNCKKDLGNENARRGSEAYVSQVGSNGGMLLQKVHDPELDAGIRNYAQV
uniref:FLZ-type domain-containing protein n=2 Tax=Kalanchoe fedtschenkoi TaxID=63787 RepID=A0A7N0U0H2_KALFE